MRCLLSLHLKIGLGSDREGAAGPLPRLESPKWPRQVTGILRGDRPWSQTVAEGKDSTSMLVLSMDPTLGSLNSVSPPTPGRFLELLALTLGERECDGETLGRRGERPLVSIECSEPLLVLLCPTEAVESV
eukprot:Hpha_TRINITY_DN10856_c0_g1::TRINITY_DN10856_c0_g1_i1::g.23272::m.23272